MKLLKAIGAVAKFLLNANPAPAPSPSPSPTPAPAPAPGGSFLAGIAAFFSGRKTYLSAAILIGVGVARIVFGDWLGGIQTIGMGLSIIFGRLALAKAAAPLEPAKLAEVVAPLAPAPRVCLYVPPVVTASIPSVASIDQPPAQG